MKIGTVALLILTFFAVVQSTMVQSQQPASTPPGSQALIPRITDAGNCGEPTITVQTLTNPFSEPCLVIIDFSVDGDMIIDGQMYQSPGTDFTFHDQGYPPCPDANGEHSDQYCRTMDVGEQITLGVRNNFRGYIYLYADVYFSRTTPAELSDANTKPN